MCNLRSILDSANTRNEIAAKYLLFSQILGDLWILRSFFVLRYFFGQFHHFYCTHFCNKSNSLFYMIIVDNRDEKILFEMFSVITKPRKKAQKKNCSKRFRTTSVRGNWRRFNAAIVDFVTVADWRTGLVGEWRRSRCFPPATTPTSSFF